MEQFRLWPQILLITGINLKSVLEPSLKIFVRCLKYKLTYTAQKIHPCDFPFV